MTGTYTAKKKKKKYTYLPAVAIYSVSSLCALMCCQ